MSSENKLVYSSEACRMISNSKEDNPYAGTLAEAAWKLAHDSCLSCVEACNTADAVEVVHGRWEHSKSMVLSAKCSKCKGWVTKHSVNEPDFRYCPGCGAKMDGE